MQFCNFALILYTITTEVHMPYRFVSFQRKHQNIQPLKGLSQYKMAVHYVLSNAARLNNISNQEQNTNQEV